MNRYKANILIYAALGLGAGSLLLFYLFLFFGTFTLINLDMGFLPSLAFDAFLSMIFFFQHSILIRKSIRGRLTKRIPDAYYGAFYAIASGAALLIMILFWQRTITIVAFEGVIYWMLRIIFILSIAGFCWGIASLGSFDPFGIEKIRLKIGNKKRKGIPLSVKGPYQWIRHPLYFFSLIMIWSCPELTADRLLFNIMWSAWIVIATFLEERDLLIEFGSRYRQYQGSVPMLIPYKVPGRK